MNAQQLAKAIGCSTATAAQWLQPLEAAMMEYGIMSRLRAAMFFAQVGHESGGLRYVQEIWGPTPAQSRYEGRLDLGNTQPGDGYRYRGRGPLQITGRANYASARDRLRVRLGTRVPDFEADPDKLCETEWSAYAAGDFWDSRKLNTWADLGDVETVSRKINGGTNGLADRKARYATALEVLA